MRIDCPACGKANASENNAACSRCGCDLAKLEKILQAALAHLASALQALKDQQWPVALRHAETGWSLRHSQRAAYLAFFAAAALGDTPRAIRWHRTAAEAETTA
jgi:hypothetical protein